MNSCQEREEHALVSPNSPHTSSVDSTGLTEHKTDDRNGITLKTALTAGRYSEQATRPQALEVRIAEKAKARGNALDTPTSAR
jgi:hypothetical protein